MALFGKEVGSSDPTETNPQPGSDQQPAAQFPSEKKFPEESPFTATNEAVSIHQPPLQMTPVEEESPFAEIPAAAAAVPATSEPRNPFLKTEEGPNNPAAQPPPLKPQNTPTKIEVSAEEIGTMREAHKKVMNYVGDLVFEANLRGKNIENTDIKQMLDLKEEGIQIVSEMQGILVIGAPYARVGAIQRLKEETDRQILAGAYTTNPDELKEYISGFKSQVQLLQRIETLDTRTDAFFQAVASVLNR